MQLFGFGSGTLKVIAHGIELADARPFIGCQQRGTSRTTGGHQGSTG